MSTGQRAKGDREIRKTDIQPRLRVGVCVSARSRGCTYGYFSEAEIEEEHDHRAELAAYALSSSL